MTTRPITMPVLSDTMHSGRLVSWQKRIGERVTKGDPLAEIESDKAVMDLEAFEDGYLAGPLAEPGRDIPVGTVIGYLADTPAEAADTEGGTPESTAATTASPEGADTAPAPTDIPPPSPGDAPTPRQEGKVRASPYARGLARELGIELSRIAPGEDGIIRSRQVLAAALTGPDPSLQSGPPWRYRLFTPMHRAIADNMTATLHTPTFRVSAELPVAPLLQTARDQEGSFTLLLARAAALTVRDHPRFNMAYTARALVERQRVDVGIAVDLPGGLLTPVVRDAAGCTLTELREQWRRLKQMIRRQRLPPEEYQGATFYLSNMGNFSVVRSFDAIVPLGAAAILAVGSERDGHAIMTLACDHRVVYGADAARFLETLEGYLRQPEAWAVS